MTYPRYFTLLTKDTETSPWSIAFGDYDRAIVMQEIEDTYSNDIYKVIACSGVQSEIDLIVSELNVTLDDIVLAFVRRKRLNEGVTAKAIYRHVRTHKYHGRSSQSQIFSAMVRLNDYERIRPVARTMTSHRRANGAYDWVAI